MELSFANGMRELNLMKKLDYVRIAGTPEELRAAHVLSDELKSFGINARLEPFELNTFQELSALLEVKKPYCKAYTVQGYGMCGNTGENGITAPLVYAEDGDEISLSFINGKIVMLNAALTAAMYDKIVKRGAVGFITISGTPFDDPDKTDLPVSIIDEERHLKNNSTKRIPGCAIRYMDAYDLLKSEPSEICLFVNQKQITASSANIVADIKGTSRQDEVVLFVAHYDSVPYSNGAYDNSSGCAIIMEMCRYFKEYPPKRSVRFIWFGAEERGLRGSAAYVLQHKDELENMVLAVNIDLAGHLIGSHHAVISADKSLCDIVTFLAKRSGFGIEVRQDIFSSDSSRFADSGVPSMSFYRGGFSGCHTRNDTIDLISERSLSRTADFLCSLGESLVNSDVFPVPREIPQSIKDSLAVYFNR